MTDFDDKKGVPDQPSRDGRSDSMSTDFPKEDVSTGVDTTLEGTRKRRLTKVGYDTTQTHDTTNWQESQVDQDATTSVSVVDKDKGDHPIDAVAPEATTEFAIVEGQDEEDASSRPQTSDVADADQQNADLEPAPLPPLPDVLIEADEPSARRNPRTGSTAETPGEKPTPDMDESPLGTLPHKASARTDAWNEFTSNPFGSLPDLPPLTAGDRPSVDGQPGSPEEVSLVRTKPVKTVSWDELSLVDDHAMSSVRFGRDIAIDTDEALTGVSMGPMRQGHDSRGPAAPSDATAARDDGHRDASEQPRDLEDEGVTEIWKTPSSGVPASRQENDGSQSQPNERTGDWDIDSLPDLSDPLPKLADSLVESQTADEKTKRIRVLHPEEVAASGKEPDAESRKQAAHRHAPSSSPGEAPARRTMKERPSERSLRHALTPGTDVIAEKYQIIERIGVGGMARIFKVKHVDLGKFFALKIIHTGMSDDPKMRKMFYREARLASSLDHPNIVQVTDFGEDPQYGAFIVMEYLHGETLHARLREEGRLRLKVACEIVLNVAEALYLIHEKDVVHCDVKSENVFLCKGEGRRRHAVKLLDFGLSHTKAISRLKSLPLADVGGTPAYMAPERIRRKPPTPSMDIYSLGVLFYEIVTGTLPFSGDMEQVLMAHLTEKPDPPSSRIHEPLDERVDELILKALSKKPADRQKDMGAFIYELRTLMNMLGFGQRRGGQGTSTLAKKTHLRIAEHAQEVFRHSPVPLFYLDPSGLLVLTNDAFASFLGNKASTLNGHMLKDSKLARVCPEIMDDLDRAIQNQSITQRIITIPERNTGRETSLLLWLVPIMNHDQVTGLVGVIHPYQMQV